MPEILLNTGPIIALVAATDSLDFLSRMYDDVLIPGEVVREIQAGGSDAPELVALRQADDSLRVLPLLDAVAPELSNQLDPGEASVIQNARETGTSLVAIDEKIGRRVARLHGLNVTGSLGILIRARKEGFVDDLASCVKRMHRKGIWMADHLVRRALAAAGENPETRLKG